MSLQTTNMQPAVGAGPSPAPLPLKPERIQQRLEALPGWELVPGETGIRGTFVFPGARPALAFVAYAAELASARGRKPEILLTGSVVTVTVSGEGAIGEAELDFAEDLMLLPDSGPGKAGEAEAGKPVGSERAGQKGSGPGGEAGAGV